MLLLLLSLHVLLMAWPIYAMRGDLDRCVHYNASGSVSVPFPQPPNSSPATPSGNYTLSTYISYNPATPPHQINWAFVATNANGDPLAAQKFDYGGCFIWLTKGASSPVSRSNNHINEPTEASCSAGLSSECMSDIIQSVHSAALGFSQQNREGYGRACFDIMPKSCDGVVEFTDSTLFVKDLPAQFRNTSNNCPAHTFNHDALVIGFHNEHGNAQYFNYLKGATPVVVVAWNKASSNGGKPWADTRLFCVSADHVVPGSESGATIAKPGWCGVILSATVALVTFILHV